jgi:hypothetical protein
MILLIPIFSDTDEARKKWCGKYLIIDRKILILYDNYAK